MTVFKGFLTITRRNLRMVFLYFVIFISICLMVNTYQDPPESSFQPERLNIAVVDHDGGALAAGLTGYLSRYHTVRELPDDPDILQDKLFYREIYYIVTIPKDFEEKCLNNDEKLAVTKVPGSTTGFYVDQQINTYLNNVKVMTRSGFSLEEAIEKVQTYAAVDTKVTMLDKNGHGGSIPSHALLFQFLPYVLMAILCYALGYIMFEFNQSDIRKKMLCSAVSSRSMNGQLVLGYAIFGLVIWILCILLPLLLYQTEFVSDPNLRHYLANSFIFTLVSLALAFLVSQIIHNEMLLSAVVNVITLGMSFTCGVFVSLDIISKTVTSAAHFLPVYWYEVNNSLLSNNRSLSASQLHSLYTGYGIQLLFAAAILSVALMIGRNRRQAEN